jgi:hypothetical protein
MMSANKFGLAAIVVCITAWIAWFAYMKGHDVGLKKGARDNHGMSDVEAQRLIISTLKAERDSKQAELRSYEDAIKTAEKTLSELERGKRATENSTDPHAQPSPSPAQ